GGQGPLDGGAGALGDVTCVAGVGAEQQQREVVAAEAGNQVVAAHGAAQRVGGGAQRLVSARVTALLVHQLEAVEVEGDDGEGGLRLLGRLEVRAQALVEAAVVGEAGEAVGGGEL